VSVAQEHLASGVVRDVLGSLLQTAAPVENGPTLVATTVAGEPHELGAMMAAVVAAVAGWRVIYLGPNLPGDEIARVAKESRAAVTALSIVNPQPTKSLRQEFEALRGGLGKRATVVAGGASAADHRLTMLRASIVHVENRGAFASLLDKVRART
jgi:methanogenic corrinoid protein MtbC1